MILVSPFEASGQDLEWPAVRQWLETLGGVQPWLSNLRSFNMSLVPVTNALRAEEYLENQTVDEEGLFKFKPAVAHLLKWIHAVCATVGALTQREVQGPLQLALDGRHWNVALLLIKECGVSMEEIDLSGKNKVCQCVCSKSIHALLNALVAHTEAL